MSASEATQFFQFDKEGNMYVFALGAGCTGPIKLVRPGDEMIFNCSYNLLDWGMESQLNAGDTSLASICPVADTSHTRDFKPPLSESEFVQLANKDFSDETMKQIRWVQKMSLSGAHTDT